MISWKGALGMSQGAYDYLVSHKFGPVSLEFYHLFWISEVKLLKTRLSRRKSVFLLFIGYF